MQHRGCTIVWRIVASNTSKPASNKVSIASNIAPSASNTVSHSASNTKQRWDKAKYNEYMRAYMAARRSKKLSPAHAR